MLEGVNHRINTGMDAMMHGWKFYNMWDRCGLMTQPTQRVGRMDGTHESITLPAGTGTGEIILPVQVLICLVVFILAFAQCQKNLHEHSPRGSVQIVSVAGLFHVNRALNRHNKLADRR